MLAETYLKSIVGTSCLLKEEDVIHLDMDRIHSLLEKNDLDGVYKEIASKSLELIGKFYTKSVNTLIAGMVHELRSPLQSLYGAGELLRTTIDKRRIDKEDVIFCANIFEDARIDIDEIIQSMRLCGSTLSSESIEKVDIKHLISNVVKSIHYREEFKSTSAELKTYKYDNIPDDFYTVPSFIFHILTNLVCNSCNAIKSGGIKSGEVGLFLDYDEVEDKLVIDIHDNGIGIPDNEFEDIFMPFYSHKLVKNSDGLGLFISRTMANKMHGNIAVIYSRPGKTIMRVALLNLKGEFSDGQKNISG